MDLNEAIKSRRTIRKFTDYVVTDEEIIEILEAASLAPSWANTQTWEYIIVRDKSLIEEITATYSSTNPARECSLSASVLIIGCIKKYIAGYRGEEKRTILDGWDMFDLGSSVENLSLKAHSLGLGSVIVGSMDHEKCKEILSIPDNYEVVVSIPVGKPHPDLPSKNPKRKELKSFVHGDKFGSEFIK